MTYKEIDASRNRRLWITDIIIPVTTLIVTTAIALPDTRKAIGRSLVRLKDSVKNKLPKGSKRKNRVVISIKAKDRQEALIALEVLVKDVITTTQDIGQINKTVQVKDFKEA